MHLVVPRIVALGVAAALFAFVLPAAERSSGTAVETPPVAHAIAGGGFTAALPVPDKPVDPVTFLGVAVGPVDPALAAHLHLPEGQGLVITFVEPDGPAAQAGLKQYDVLTKLDDQILIESRQLSVLVRHRKEGDKVALTYIRGGAEARTSATLAKRIPPAAATFFWRSEDAAPLFEKTLVPGMPADVVRGVWQHRVETLAPDLPANGNPIRTVPGMPATPRIMIFRPQADIVISDAAGTLVVRSDESGQTLTAKNPSGEVQFSGPIGTPEQRAALPTDIRERLEKFEQMDVFKAERIAPPAVTVPSAGVQFRQRAVTPPAMTGNPAVL